MGKSPRWRQVAGYVVVPILIDIFLAWYLLVKEIPQTKTTIMGGLRFSPDLYLLIMTILLFTLVWGTIRTILILQTIFSKNRSA